MISRRSFFFMLVVVLMVSFAASVSVASEPRGSGPVSAAVLR